MIIYNLLYLILTNTLLPYVPLTPLAYLPAPLLQPLITAGNSTIYEIVGLNRIHTEADQRIAFREAMKSYHPDRGGSAVTFDRIRSTKNIIANNETSWYYDLLGIESFDGITRKAEVANHVNNKITILMAEIGMFYLIALIYSLGLTIHNDAKYLRKYILLLLAACAALEVSAFLNPRMPTFIDFIYPKTPLFQQLDIFKNIFSIGLVVLRIIQIRRMTPEKTILKSLQTNYKQIESQGGVGVAMEKPKSSQISDNSSNQYVKRLDSMLGSIRQLNSIYTVKLQEVKKHEQSFIFKVKSWVTKGLSLFFFVMFVMSVIRR